MKAKRGTHKILGLDEIKSLIPHREPFILVDKITSIVAGESAIGINDLSMEKDFFRGHFPNRPIMPGVLILEALAQTAAVLISYSLGLSKSAQPYLMGIDKARFRMPVMPGDCLYLKVQKLTSRAKVWKFSGIAEVKSNKVAMAEILAMYSS